MKKLKTFEEFTKDAEAYIKNDDAFMPNESVVYAMANMLTAIKEAIEEIQQNTSFKCECGWHLAKGETVCPNEHCKELDKIGELSCNKKGAIINLKAMPLVMSTKEIARWCELTDEELKDYNIDPRQIRRLNKQFNKKL